MLLAFPAEPRPRHSFEPSLGNGFLAGFANAERSRPEPRKRIIDRPQETNIGLVQVNLKIRFGIGVRLITEIPLRYSGAQDGR